MVDVFGHSEIRKVAERPWMLGRGRRLVYRVGRAHSFTDVMRVVPSFRHHRRIVEISTGFSQPA
jgi:hypothetical protein